MFVAQHDMGAGNGVVVNWKAEKIKIKTGRTRRPPLHEHSEKNRERKEKSSRPTVPCDGAENEPVGRRWVPAETL
jgi:hypothetical protein